LSTATASQAKANATAGATHFLLRRLHSLTGILFGGYLIVHLLINATLVEGSRPGADTTVYQEQVNKIHSLPLLPVIEWTFIYLPIIYHTIYGIWIVATGQPNVGNYNYGKNWAYFFQRVSAVILIFFIAFHVLTFKNTFGLGGDNLAFDPAQATATAQRHIQANPWITWGVYPIGILAGTFHLANGFWAAAITWGLTVSRQAQKRWAMVCVGLFLLTTTAGFAALLSAALADPAKTPPATQPAGGYYETKSGVH
jgi:succinate dehydrogenase / fumarate reductase, cytochrome b subunit